MEKIKFTEESFNDLCENVSKQTQKNEHTLSKLLISEFFDIAYYVKIFTYISAIHEIDGYMCKELCELRERKTNEMICVIQGIYGKEYGFKLIKCL